ncbi:putative cation-transporting ATPase 13A3 [Portunus trituberculatus]|uniref:Cation-transporting ATPase n=1 Tax=Portunus trituberculatus TaxID=210409 RepID=A0A5B7D4H3_PORTR|nr:putative cation-transporting ATPase 13A3 [Portunus trituberculatus]
MRSTRGHGRKLREIYGYRRSKLKTGITWFFIVVSAGFLRLVFHWVPVWMLKATHSQCSLEHATKVLIVEYFKKYKRNFVKNISEINAHNIRARKGRQVGGSSHRDVTAWTGGVMTSRPGPVG